MLLLVDETLLLQRPSWSVACDELVDLEGDGAWCARSSGELWLQVDADRIRLRGELLSWVPRECDRCLAHYLESVPTNFEEVCLVGGVAGAAPSWDEDAEVWRVGLGGRLDLTEMVRQAILLAMPTRADCGQRCRAAREPEVAPPRRSDPRLAVLSQLMRVEGEDDGVPEETG
jgi:uncharacterized metal-binding protein YceD (DUF177 family)